MDVYHSKSRELRGEIIERAHYADAMHVGSCLSCLDLLLGLYKDFLRIDPQNPLHENRDRFILSKGHASLALYVVLAECGFFSREELQSFNSSGSLYTEHPVLGNVPGVEASSGSLGHGPGIGLGMALAARITRRSYRTVVLLSDGECNEGTVWEAALLAPVHALGNLFFIVDYNKWQATDQSNQIMALDSLAEKFSSFGWDAHEVDGHDIRAFLNLIMPLSRDTKRPHAIIAHTVKGKGVSFMEDDNNWHYRVPSREDVTRAHQELGLL